jgi:hypothetical protein
MEETFMAAKGTIAKQKVAQKIAEIFGQDFVGEFDKKLYVWTEENGEQVQVAISMTCPKNPVGGEARKIDFKAETGNSLNFEDMSAAPVPPQSIEISEEEKQNIADLMAKLGL